ncbi:hypothetical protein M408DRAFT_333946 [Serendipita vermifera MAFF 305830]|uniref:Uncharacterized protein n=1 Tax=Serendipita vermifera MAFF 305830 TaxID=933852 RepID=A0A0C3AMM9_SERVB|nr:hypothetical protein M408DRAFT_333946 [Serendipita vermifera MAFF 305830]
MRSTSIYLAFSLSHPTFLSAFDLQERCMWADGFGVKHGVESYTQKVKIRATVLVQIRNNATS